jgi:hypothetical protein
MEGESSTGQRHGLLVKTLVLEKEADEVVALRKRKERNRDGDQRNDVYRVYQSLIVRFPLTAFCLFSKIREQHGSDGYGKHTQYEFLYTQGVL